MLPEMTVTARPEPATGYSVPNATSATKTDTPIFDTPVSIQVIPRELLDDQQAFTAQEALKTSPVSGRISRPAGRSTRRSIFVGFRPSGIPWAR
ncbi:MAG: hypothetical protein ACREYE_00665 [Gammaproteobacteria bacterium]